MVKIPIQTPDTTPNEAASTVDTTGCSLSMDLVAPEERSHRPEEWVDLKKFVLTQVLDHGALNERIALPIFSMDAVGSETPYVCGLTIDINNPAVTSYLNEHNFERRDFLHALKAVATVIQVRLADPSSDEGCDFSLVKGYSDGDQFSLAFTNAVSDLYDIREYLRDEDIRSKLYTGIEHHADLEPAMTAQGFYRC